MAKMSNTDVIIQNDIKRYKKNSSASWLIYLSIGFLILYFLILYANSVGSSKAMFGEMAEDGTAISKSIFGSTSVYTYMFGVDVILNLCVLLFGFYAGVKIGGYSKTFSYVAFVLAAIQIGRIFLIPFTYVNEPITGGYENAMMLETYDFIWLVVMLAASAACLVLGGVLGYMKAVQRENFQKQLDEGAVDLEVALRDENDVLSKDETPLDVFGDDLDSGKTGEDDTSDESLLEAETTSVGGE